MMRKSRHRFGFLEAAKSKPLFSSRCDSDRLYEDRITPLKGQRTRAHGGRTGGKLSNVAEQHHLDKSTHFLAVRTIPG